MVLTKRQWIFLIIGLLILIFILFIFINVHLFSTRLEISKEARGACDSLEEGEECSFFCQGREFHGICKKDKASSGLVCRI